MIGRLIWIKCSWPGGVLAFISGVNGRGSCLPSHLGAEQLEEEDQLLELRLVSELGSGGVSWRSEAARCAWAGDGARHGLAPFIGEESSNGVAQGRRRRGLRQLVVNANSGSTEGVSAEAAKPARALQRRGRGGDAGVGGTA